MKKLVLALTAVAAFTGSALAADLPARTYTKAPVIVETPSWTGFYIFGGGGYGLWDANTYSVNTATGNATSIAQRSGGDGYVGTVGAGYDWQLSQSWVGGIFADGQFGSIRGSLVDPTNALAGTEKDKTNWAAGLRLGYVVAPTVLSYVNGGYSGSNFSGTTLATAAGVAAATTPSFSRSGWFLGGGVENQLGVLGFGPNWFMKTEYRVAEYNKATLTESTLAGVPTTAGTTYSPIVQTVTTSLVYRFNWTGPVVAKY